ncbi:MAG TPA: DNA polymerase III subunit gamma/tau [Symbiobacteriaceae bacterium]|nr:DNA polymerase III subunit gamma/tau [Symbiobacteriaceae bacterium]
MTLAHLALYREFRPQRFADVVGQQHITRTLRNAIVHHRLHHAYLLSGPRGTGKTTVARLLAKAVNCLQPVDGEPCNECSACTSINSGEAMDVLEIDAASNRGIDEIRDLRDKVKFAPVDLTYKVYIIDEVHMLSEPAFNALLKTLEEPPSHVLFVLATTEKHKLPITILSRCQAFDYHRHSVTDIIGRLGFVCEQVGMKAQPEALTAIARQAEGGMRDALSLLDQVMAFAEGEITLQDTLHVLGSAPLDQFLQLDDHLTEGSVGGALLLLDELVRQGKDLRQLVRDLLAHLRDLLMLKVEAGGSVLDLPAHALAGMKERAAKLDQPQILGAIRLLSQLETEMRFAASPRLLVEVALIRLAGLFSGQAPLEAARVEAPAPLPRPGAPAARPVSQAETRPSAAAPVEARPTGPEPAPEEPEAAPLTTAQTGPVGAEAAQIDQRWSEVTDLVKKARPSTFPLLASTKVGTVRGKTLYLIGSNPVFINLLKRPADKEIIEKAITRAGLGEYEVVVVGPDDPTLKLVAEAAPAAPAPDPVSPILERAIEVFGEAKVKIVKEETAE